MKIAYIIQSSEKTQQEYNIISGKKVTKYLKIIRLCSQKLLSGQDVSKGDISFSPSPHSQRIQGKKKKKHLSRDQISSCINTQQVSQIILSILYWMLQITFFLLEILQRTFDYLNQILVVVCAKGQFQEIYVYQLHVGRQAGIVVLQYKYLVCALESCTTFILKGITF